MSADTRRVRYRRPPPKWVATAFAVAICSTGSWAQAEPKEAETLFHEGRQLLKEGRIEAACSKLTESQALDPSSGTLLNLAHCHQEQGKYATAYAEFTTAAELAVKQKSPRREAEARSRADELLPRLSYLVIRIASPEPLLEVHRNGVKLERAAFNQPIAVDPGSQEIRAAAPGHTEWALTLRVRQPGQHVVDVPELALRGVPLAAPARSRDESNGVRPVRSSPIHRDDAPAPSAGGLPAGFWAFTGSGIVAAGIGTAAGVMSLLNYKEAEKLCSFRTGCNPDAMAARGRAGTQATIANVAFGTAVVAAGVGAYFFVTSRNARSNATTQPKYRPGVTSSSSQPALGWSW